MSISPGMAAFRLSFEVSPIIFTRGIANLIPGGALPIISVTQALDFIDGLLGGAAIDIEEFFARFVPVPGSTLAENEYGKYPFANQAVAANARIKQPRKISLRMICPARGEAGYALKLATMTALTSVVEQHAALGGTYTVATPSYFYTDCLLTSLVDVSPGDSKQAQNTYQWDFWQPLLTLSDALQAQNNLMSRITAGLPISGAPAWSGLAPTVGVPPSLGSVGLIPAASGTAASLASSPSGNLPT